MVLVREPKLKKRRISTTDLRKNLTDVLNRTVYAGENFVICKNVKPLALISKIRSGVLPLAAK